MLEVNPNLGWRDVQGVLASSAMQVDLADESWTTNAAGILHSSKYGFGIVDATAAVAAARAWQRWGAELSILGESGPVDTVIPDNELQQLQSTMTVEDTRNLVTESVVVFLDLTHGSSGDLEISLTSPGGTKSILSPGNRPVSWQLEEEERWKFLTYSEWGAAPQGDWTLSVVDRSPGLVRDCENNEWELVQPDGVTYTCSSFEGVTDCEDASEFPDQSILTGTFEGRTPLDACCACGGGVDLTTIPNVLKSWRLLIYAHDNDEVVTYPPTATSVATSAPTIPSGDAVPSSSIPPGGVAVPTGPPIPLAPVPLTQAVVMTIPPNVTNLPFVTSGELNSGSVARSSLPWASLPFVLLLLSTTQLAILE